MLNYVGQLSLRPLLRKETRDVVILSLAAILVVGVFVLVVMNRASEKIITAVIPIGVAAVTGILLSLFVFGAEPAIEEVFFSSFMYAVDTKMPPSFPWVYNRRFTAAQFAPAALFKDNPTLFKDKADEEGRTLYHHLLQKSLVDWMGMLYRGSWQTEILTFESATGRETRFQPAQATVHEPSTVLVTEEVTKLLGGNKFAGINTGIPPQIALPPNSKLIVKPPAREGTIFEIGEIIIKNNFCTVSIRTESSGGIRSIGEYQDLAGLSDEQSKNLWTSTYIVRFKVGFSRWLSGNPEMPKIRKWARQLADGMKSQFDEQLIWQAVRNDYLFLKAIEQPKAPPRGQ